MSVLSAVRSRSLFLRDFLWGSISTLVSLLVGIWVVGGFSRSLNEPWVSNGDLIPLYIQIFGLQESGNAQLIPGHGWPFQLDITTFFITDWLAQGFYRTLLFFFEPFAVLNAYIILGFGLIAAVTYIAWRLLSFSPIVAAITSIALALAPWHLQRALVHPTYAFYISVPLFIIFISLFIRWQENRKNSTFFTLVFILVAISISTEYFWVFSFIFLILLILYSLYFYKNFSTRNLLNNFILILIIPVSTLINFIYQNQISIYPNLASTVEREFAQVELYSGSFMSLLMPSPLTAIPFLDNLRINFDNASLYLNNENHPWSSVFIIASILIAIALLFFLAFARKDKFFNINNSQDFQIKLFILLFFTGILFYWTTGLGSFFGFFISDWMRSWGRMYIFIAYFAVAAAMLFLKHSGLFSNVNKNLKIATLISIVAIIVLDQTINQIPVQAEAKKTFEESAEFSQNLSKEIDPSCPVLQIPIFPFPEAGYNLNDLVDYDHFWLALADNSRPYSYGANKAHQQFLWQNNLTQDDPRRLAVQAAAVGYCVIVVDLSAYESRVEEGNRWIEALGSPIAVSETARWAAWPVATNYSKEQIRELISLNWFGTFAAGEVQESVQIDFYEQNFDLFALNPTAEKITGEISFKAISGTCTPSQNVTITDTASNQVLVKSDVTKEPKLLSFEINLEPREQKRIHFELSSRVCTVEWWSDTKVAFREQEFKLN